MNPQPNSHDYPGVIELMFELEHARCSLDDFQKKKKHPENMGTSAYESLLTGTVNDLQAKLERLCAHYSIEITSS
jgi:hypothetical protein